MNQMLRILKLFHIHIQRYHHRSGANVYTQCRCGRRDYYSSGGYSPLDRQWLQANGK
jgi:hypothetical protein